MNDDEYVYIKWKEYKELLIIKGKYEELKSNQSPINFPPIQKTTITYTGPDGKSTSIPDTSPKATW